MLVAGGTQNLHLAETVRSTVSAKTVFMILELVSSEDIIKPNSHYKLTDP